jgi:hypothetical protein
MIQQQTKQNKNNLNYLELHEKTLYGNILKPPQKPSRKLGFATLVKCKHLFQRYLLLSL